MIALLLLFLLCGLVYYWVSLNRGYWASRGVPSPRSELFFGNYKDIILARRQFGVIFREWYNEFPSAPLVGYLKLRQPALLVRDPALIKELLVTQFNNFANNDVYVDKAVDFLFGYNPFVLNGEAWRASRAHLTPTVTAARLRSYLPATRAVCDRLCDHLHARLAYAGGDLELETKQLCNTYTTDVVATAVFGVDCDSFARPDNVFVRITSSLLKGTFIDHFKIMAALVFPALGKHLHLRFTSREAEEAMLSLTRQSLQSRLAAPADKHDFFTHILNYKQADTQGVFTDKYVAAHCFGFMADGTETSSDVMCFTLYELAWNEDVQDKLRKEILEKLGEVGGAITYEALSEMPYLDMVVYESLRLHPPVMAMTRLCTQPTRLGALLVSPGTPVSVSTYGLHSDPAHYPHPDRFQPERFAADAARDKFTFLPFGEGPRVCPGMKFALQQIKCGLVALLSRLRVRPSPRSPRPPPVDPNYFLKRPLNGAWVRFQPL